MNAEENRPKPWLRMCATVVGAVFGVLVPALLLFLAFVFTGFRGQTSMVVWMLAAGGAAGGTWGFIHPHRTLDGVLILLPGRPE